MSTAGLTEIWLCVYISFVFVILQPSVEWLHYFAIQLVSLCVFILLLFDAHLLYCFVFLYCLLILLFVFYLFHDLFFSFYWCTYIYWFVFYSAATASCLHYASAAVVLQISQQWDE